MGEVVGFPHAEKQEGDDREKRTLETVFNDMREYNVVVVMSIVISSEGEAVMSSTTYDPLVLKKLASLAEDASYSYSESVSSIRIEDLLKEPTDGDS